MFSPKVLIPLTCNHEHTHDSMKTLIPVVTLIHGSHSRGITARDKTSHFIRASGCLRFVRLLASSWSCHTVAPCTVTALWSAQRSNYSTSLACYHPCQNYALQGKHNALSKKKILFTKLNPSQSIIGNGNLKINSYFKMTVKDKLCLSMWAS